MTTLAAPDHPRSHEDIPDWITRGDLARAQQARVSGYVAVNDCHFHVSKTISGPLVCLVQWHRADDGSLIPKHNLFAVTPDQRDHALHAWDSKLAAERCAPSCSDTESAPRTRTSLAR